MDIIVPQPINLEPITYSRASIATARNSRGLLEIFTSNALRFDYFLAADGIPVFNGVLIEPSRTNYLLNTSYSLTPGDVIPRQLENQTVSPGFSFGSPSHLVLSFYGKGSVTVSGGGFSYTLDGRDNSDGKPAYLTFPVRAANLSITVTGMVYAANLEGLVNFSTVTDTTILTKMTRPTSWIPTLSVPMTRAKDVLNNSGFIYSSFTEEALAWNASTTYSIGDIVDRNYLRWISSSDENIGNEPSATSNFWVKVQSVNTVALVDRGENSTSIQEQGATGAYFSYGVKLNNPSDVFNTVPGSIHALFDSAAMFEVNAKYAELIVSVSTNAGLFSEVVKGNTYSGSLLNKSVLDDLYEYLTFYTSLEIYNCTVSLRLHNGLDTEGDTIDPTLKVSINELVFGVAENLGRTAYGMRTGIIDYSKKETNEFGVTSFVKRGFSKTMSCNVYVENEDYNRVVETLQSVLAEPTAWIGTEVDGYSNGALIFGAFKDYTLTISYPTYSMLNIEVQGLVV